MPTSGQMMKARAPIDSPLVQTGIEQQQTKAAARKRTQWAARFRSPTRSAYGFWT